MTRRIVALWAVLALPFALVIAWLPPNADSAWLLYVAREVSRGAVLGRDVLEVNPPLIVWLKVPVVMAGELVGAAPGVAWALAVALLILGLAFLADRLLRADEPAWTMRQRTLFAGWLLFVATFEGGSSYGQRDHLAALLVLPYLLAVGLRWGARAVPRGPALAAGIAAGVGFALKPFFVPLYLAAEASLALRHRSLRSAWRAESLATAGVLAAYGLAIPLLAPHWLAAARAFWPLYADYAPLAKGLFLSWHVGRFALAAGAVVALVAWWRQRDRGGALAAGFLLGIVGFALAFVLQWKGWSYLTVPLGVMSLTGAGAAWLRMAPRATRAGGLARALLVSLLGTVAACYVVWEVGRARMLQDYFWGDRAHGAFMRMIERIGRPQRLVVLSTGHGMAFPMALELDLRWGMRLQSLWPLVTIHDLRAARDAHRLPIRTPKDMAHGVDSLLTRILVEDVAACPPDLLLVPEPRDTLVPAAASHAFDYLAYFAHDSVLARTFARYHEIGRVPDYLVFARSDSGAAPVTASCAAAGRRSSR